MQVSYENSLTQVGNVSRRQKFQRYQRMTDGIGKPELMSTDLSTSFLVDMHGIVRH